LLPSLAAGDERAFALLYDRFATRMYRVALRLLGRPEDAEDVVQEVFLGVVRSRERLADVSDIAAYLFVSLHRAAGRYAQRRAKAPKASLTLVSEVESPIAEPAPDRAEYDRLYQAVQSLPSRQREVIAWKIDGELTFAQIAQVMGVSINTAASRYRYALQKLRALLKGRGDLFEETR
jgi:RNA polymerase sigma-70 factor (ECF subfamily)